MMTTILHFPATGWCVRPGARCAHYLGMRSGERAALCGSVDRPEQYAPQRLRPRQAGKPRCSLCEERLRQRAAA